MKARLVNGELEVKLFPFEVREAVALDRTVATRYGHLFDQLPHGFRPGGELSVSPASSLGVDYGIDMQPEISLNNPDLQARLYTDGDIALHVSSSYLDSTIRRDRLTIQAAEIIMSTPEVAERMSLGSISLYKHC